jgi:hypothetical protein
MLLPHSGTSKGNEGVKTVRYLLFLHDIAIADLFLRQRMKSELAGVYLSQESSETSWDGVVRNIAKKESAAAIRQYIDRSKNSV